MLSRGLAYAVKHGDHLLLPRYLDALASVIQNPVSHVAQHWISFMIAEGTLQPFCREARQRVRLDVSVSRGIFKRTSTDRQRFLARSSSDS